MDPAALSLSVSNYDTQTQDAAKARPGFQVLRAELHNNREHDAQHRAQVPLDQL